MKHSLCKNPIDIEAREIENTTYFGFDWIGSNSILIYDTNKTNVEYCGNSPNWSYGISSYFGYALRTLKILFLQNRIFKIFMYPHDSKRKEM